MPSEQNFLAVLRNRDFLKLYIGQLGSGVGDRLHQMALLGVLIASDPSRQFTANGPDSAKLIFFGTLPVLLFSVLAVSWTDRWSRKATMVAADFLRAAFAFCIPLIRQFDPSVRALYGVVFVMGTLATFHGPARLAAMPRICDTRLLMAANSLSNSSGAVAGLLAIPLAGLVVQKLGPNLCFVLDGLTFIFSGILIAMIVRSLKPERNDAATDTPKKRTSTWQDVKSGLTYVRQHKEALPLVLLGGLFALVGGLLLVALLMFATAQLGLREFGVGMLIGIGGVGMAIGLFTVGQMQRLRHVRSLPYFACIIWGVCVAGLSQTHSPLAAGFVLVAVGACAALAAVPADTRLQEIVPDERRGGVFSVKQLLSAAAFLFALWMQFGSDWLQKISAAQILMLVGALATLGGAVLALMHRAASRGSSANESLPNEVPPH